MCEFRIDLLVNWQMALYRKHNGGKSPTRLHCHSSMLTEFYAVSVGDDNKSYYLCCQVVIDDTMQPGVIYVDGE